MGLWNYCVVCGERIETGQPCIGVKEESERLCGDSICLNCAKIENLPEGEKPASITDLLARAEAAEDALSGKVTGHKEAGETALKLLAYAKDMGLPEEIRGEMHAAAIMLFGVEEALRAAEAAEARAGKAERERDAAVSDLETIMAYNLDTCSFCKNVQCYVRGGAKPCLPKWRGQKEE